MTIGMHCPECRHVETGVVDSRTHDGLFVRRRRLCPVCQHRFTTFEIQCDNANDLKRMLDSNAKMVPMADVTQVIGAALRQLKGEFP